MKVCSKCNIEKEENEFPKCKRNKSGLAGRCKKCDLSYYYLNKSKRLVQVKEYRKNNPIKCKLYRQQERINKKKSANYVVNTRRWNLNRHYRICKHLTDSYIKKLFKNQNISGEQLAKNPELILLKKEILKIQRYVNKNKGKTS